MSLLPPQSSGTHTYCKVGKLTPYGAAEIGDMRIAPYKPKKLYLMGSLRNPKVSELAAKIRTIGYDVFDDWMAAGPVADDCWRDYERQRGRQYKAALEGHAANHVFSHDKHHLDTSDVGVLFLPAGKSAHLELGYFLGCGKPGFIYMEEEPERYDVMYKFATGIFFSDTELLEALKTLNR